MVLKVGEYDVLKGRTADILFLSQWLLTRPEYICILKISMISVIFLDFSARKSSVCLDQKSPKKFISAQIAPII